MKQANCTYHHHECLDDNDKVIAECPFDNNCTPECQAGNHCCGEDYTDDEEIEEDDEEAPFDGTNYGGGLPAGWTDSYENWAKAMKVSQ